jgi:multiple sugar transport system permease protein
MATVALREANTQLATPPRERMTPWQVWGLILIAPYVLIFLAFVVYRSATAFGCTPPGQLREADGRPDLLPLGRQHARLLIVGINLKMSLALLLSGFFVQQRVWIRWVSLLFILPWAVPSIPTILSVRFMLNPEWGVINQVIFKLTAEDGPNWLNDPQLALAFAILMHIWKSLPFWTLILVAARLSIPADLYEAASVDGASSWQKFRFVTWPSMQTVYVTSTILSMIWTLGDFNSVYLLTGGGPADLTHVLATLGIRYLRLDEVDMAMASIVCALPLVLPLVFFMMKRLSK